MDCTDGQVFRSTKISLSLETQVESTLDKGLVKISKFLSLVPRHQADTPISLRAFSVLELPSIL